MRGIGNFNGPWARASAAVLLALILGLRVAALPMVMAGAAPGPGMMAICTGSEIIYIPIGAENLSGSTPEPAPHHDPCPAFGILAVLDTPEQGVSLPSGQVQAAEPESSHVHWAETQAWTAYLSRAPPRV